LQRIVKYTAYSEEFFVEGSDHSFHFSLALRIMWWGMDNFNASTFTGIGESFFELWAIVYQEFFGLSVFCFDKFLENREYSFGGDVLIEFAVEEVPGVVIEDDEDIPFDVLDAYGSSDVDLPHFIWLYGSEVLPIPFTLIGASVQLMFLQDIVDRLSTHGDWCPDHTSHALEECYDVWWWTLEVDCYSLSSPVERFSENNDGDFCSLGYLLMNPVWSF
jgi:hypothetical protein